MLQFVRGTVGDGEAMDQPITESAYEMLRPEMGWFQGYLSDLSYGVANHEMCIRDSPGMMRNLGAITSGNIKDKILELASSGTFDVSPDVTGTPDAKYYQGEVFYVGAGRIHVQLTSLNTVEHQTYKAMYIDGMWTDWALVYDAQSMSVAAAAPTTTLADDMIVMVPR